MGKIGEKRIRVFLLFIMMVGALHFSAALWGCESELESRRSDSSQARISLKLVELSFGSPTQLAVDIQSELDFLDEYQPGPNGYQLFPADRLEALDRIRTLAEAGLIRVERLDAYFQQSHMNTVLDSKDEIVQKIVRLEVVEKIIDLKKFFQTVIDLYKDKQILMAQDAQIVINGVRESLSQLKEKKSVEYLWKLFTDVAWAYPWSTESEEKQKYLEPIFKEIEALDPFNLATTHKTAGAMHSLLSQWKTKLMLAQSEMNYQFRSFLSNTTLASDTLAFRNVINVKNFLNHLINRVEFLLVEHDIRYLRAGVVALMALREYGLMVNQLKAIQETYIYGVDNLPYLSDEEYSRQYLAGFMSYWRDHRHTPLFAGQTPLMITMSSAAMQRVLGGVAYLQSKNIRITNLNHIGATQQTFLLVFKHENKDKAVYEMIRKRDVFSSGHNLIRIQELREKKEKDGSVRGAVEIHVLDLREGVHATKRLNVRELMASDLNHLTRPQDSSIKSGDFDRFVLMMIGGVHQFPTAKTNSEN